jgi:hypothetical protein
VGKIQRSLAEKLVSAHGFPRGTFLVRKRGMIEKSSQNYLFKFNDNFVFYKNFQVNLLEKKFKGF